VPALRFSTTLHAAATGSATGIVVPPDLVEALGHGRRPPVKVTVNGHGYRTTVGVMGGDHLIPVSAAIRLATGLAAGDAIDVELELDTSPREVDVPPELQRALDAEPAAKAFFATLSNSLQRLHVENVNGAKTDETRQRRVEKAIALFLDGKAR
jgi:hypothetical protein